MSKKIPNPHSDILKLTTNFPKYRYVRASRMSGAKLLIEVRRLKLPAKTLVALFSVSYAGITVCSTGL